MKTVYLVRHGKAVERETAESDFERILIEHGINDMTAVASRLVKYGIRPSLIISSPAPRALETAKIIAECVGYPKKRIRTRKSLFDQEEGVIISLLTDLDDTVDDVMIVGHNPSIEASARYLAKNLKDSFPTSGTTGIDFNIDSWKEMTANCGKIIFFETPRSSPKPLTKKFVRNRIERKVTSCVLNVLADIDSKAAVKTKKLVRKSSAEIARHFSQAARKTRKEKKPSEKSA